ncbi:MAG TPA: TOMM precursor leader peptide-binding protein [Ktedonobacteraceae bacterium]|jgi:bacteriocin biosynthesis cyclodehydratase domain-containing protein
MLIQRMRPKYKGDTSFIPTADGVYLRNNTGRLQLKGKSLYTLLERLLPHLNGNVTLAELTADLETEKRRMVQHLIEKLLAHDFLKDTSQDQPHTLCPAEQETYASDIAFLDSLQTSPLQRFELFRHKRLLLIGCGPGAASLVQAGLQCGVKQLGVLTDGAQYTGRWVPRDAEQVVQVRPIPCWENEIAVRDAMQEYDAVVHIAEPPALSRARVLNRLCLDQQKVLIQAILQDRLVWIGPMVGPEIGNCWECAWLRVQANRDASLPEPVPDQYLTPAEAALLAQQLLFALFQFFTQTAADPAGQISVLDLATWQSEPHHFLPHPQCSVCQHPVITAAQFRAHIQQLQQQAPRNPESSLLDPLCVDERCGLFTALEFAPFVQIPLAVALVRLPATLAARVGPLAALAVGIGPEEARERAVRKACECYAAHCLPQQPLCSSEMARPFAVPVVAPDRVLGAETGASEHQGWAWALDLQTQQAVLVLAPCLPAEPGVASGESWEEALCQALLGWCLSLTLEQMPHTQRVYPRVDLAQISQAAEGAYLARLLDVCGVRVAFYDVTGSLGVPTFAVCLGERVVAYTTHYEVRQALALGLVHALQQYQADHFQQMALALAPVPDCPLERRGEQCALPDYALPDTWLARRQWLLARLQDRGLRGFAMPLDADPALARLLPFLVRVFLCQDSEYAEAMHT